jgi:hypothetical protein
MTDRSFILKWAHLGYGNPRDREVVEANRRTLEAHIAEIQAEQEANNAELHKINHRHIGPLRIAERYAAGRPRALRRRQLNRN